MNNDLTCKKCGSSVDMKLKKCPKCGTPVFSEREVNGLYSFVILYGSVEFFIGIIMSSVNGGLTKTLLTFVLLAIEIFKWVLLEAVHKKDTGKLRYRYNICLVLLLILTIITGLAFFVFSRLR